MVKQISRNAIRFLLAALLFSLLFAFGAQAQSVVRVDDLAGLLSENEIQSLKEAAARLSEAEETGIDVLLVTTDDAEGKTSEEYGDSYYLDHADSDDGVLFLIDMDNRQIHISTSGKMIYYMTDNRIEKCLDDGYQYIKDGKYAACLDVMVRDAQSYVKSGEGADYSRDRDTGEITNFREAARKELTPFDMILALIAGGVAGGGTLAFVAGKYRMKFGGYKYDFHQHSTLNLYRKEDAFVTTRVTRRHIPRNDSGGSSGGGGGSTTHSSGGHSFGGGSKSF